MFDYSKNMLDIVFSVLINILLLIGWLFVFYIFKSRREVLCFLRQRKDVILTGIIFGAFAVCASGLIESSLFNLTGIPFTEVQSKAVIGPLIEEISKLLFILMALRSTHNCLLFKTKMLGASTGLSFAFFENFLHVSNFLNVLFRGALPYLMHIVTAMVIAMGIRAWYVPKLKKSFVHLLGSLLLAMVIHGAFNFTMLLLGFH